MKSLVLSLVVVYSLWLGETSALGLPAFHARSPTPVNLYQRDPHHPYRPPPTKHSSKPPRPVTKTVTKYIHTTVTSCSKSSSTKSHRPTACHTHGKGSETHHGKPACTSPPPEFTFEELWKLQSRFWDNFLYPANVAQAKAINSSLLADDILGRVDVSRTFDGNELNTEYLFGLFANIAINRASIALLGFPVSYNIIHFTANQNIASASTVVFFNTSGFSDLMPVEIDTWIIFNEKGQIQEYDVTFRWFQFLIDTLIATATQNLGFNDTAQTIQYYTTVLATSICTTSQRYCNGTNAQYDTFEDCFNFLTTKTRFGNAYSLGMDTLLCRMVHENMVPFRPALHCPHIGPSGGGMCVDDTSYSQKVLQSYFTTQPFIPYGFASKNKTIAEW